MRGSLQENEAGCWTFPSGGCGTDGRVHIAKVNRRRYKDSDDRSRGGRVLAKSPKVLILNGPNLNMLGVRETAIYGAETLADIERMCTRTAKKLSLAVDFRQSNLEGELVTWVQEARTDSAGIVINPGAYGHTSIALLDALRMADKPVIELHLSNIHRREAFRHHTYTSQAATGVICGLGAHGYPLALEAMAELISRKDRA
jgi:3-dehydroquinate dehydratase II